LVTLGAGAVVLVALLACKKKPAPLSFNANPVPAVQKHYKLTVNSAKQCEVRNGNPPDDGKVYFGIDMTFEGTTPETVAVYSYEMKLTDSKGGSYGTSLFQCEPRFPEGRYVKSGERLQGIMTFQVPEQATELVLTFENVVSPSIGMEAVKIELRR
jgi:hypothetical protein